MKLYKHRFAYWSCTNFADKIRGTKMPHSETIKGWEDWRKQSKESHPIRYYIADELLDSIQNIIYFPYDVYRTVKSYLKNRFIYQSHVLKSSKEDIPRGQWCDLSNRMIYCLFNELVDFVEFEKAHLQMISNKDRYYTTGLERRSAQAGIEYLAWESTLIYDEKLGVSKEDSKYGKKTDQALAADEIYKLYFWWKNTRKNRVDPMVASGYGEFLDTKELSEMDEMTKEEKKQIKKLSKKCYEIEDQYDKEDEEMMIRLIKIRHSLWT